jgi:hypothetical protein
MDDRLDKKNTIIKLLKNVPENTCITGSNASLNNIFFVKKRIGTKSKYGHVYLLENKKKLNIALKVIDVSNLNKHEMIQGQDIELYILNMLKSKESINSHFLMIYGIYNCTIDSHKDVWIHDQRAISTYTDETLSTVKTEDHILILSELASGDLKSIIKNKKMFSDKNLMINVSLQCILCIFLFHKLGFKHNDAHYGNFLYHKKSTSSKSPSCICYKYKNKKYYLEDVGITMNIWDFGLSKRIITKKNKISSMKDYIRILRILYSELPYSYTTWFNTVPNLLLSITTKDETLLPTEHSFITTILKNMFHTKPIGNVIDTITL